jgi:signal transduction histidine kinase
MDSPCRSDFAKSNPDMPNKTGQLSLGAIYPIRVFILILVLMFTVEGGIMFALPLLPSWCRIPSIQAMIDAALLTLATAPAVWWMAVLPIRQLFEARGQLLQELFTTQEQERSRIARDLHDGVGQQLTALLLGLRAIESASELPTAKLRAKEVRELAAATHDEVRRIARGLRPGVLEELGLAAAIQRICEDASRAGSLAIRTDFTEAACANLPAAAETALYRIVQEVLANIGRHAQADQVQLTIRRDPKLITMTINDNGRGFSLAELTQSKSSGGMGLDSIRERAVLLGGNCRIQSEPGRGTTIEVSLPV